MSFKKFSAVEDNILVQSVKKFPIIYLKDRCQSKNADTVKNTWRSVAESVGREEECCRKRWRDIRDHFFKARRKQLAGCDIKWTLFKKLSFLSGVKQQRRLGSEAFNAELMEDHSNSFDLYEPLTTVKVEADAEEMQPSDVENFIVEQAQSAENDLPPTSDPGSDFCLVDFRVSTDRRLSLLEANVRTIDEDDVDAFMRSVALSMKKLTPEGRAQAKIKILSIVTQLEFPDLNPAGQQGECNL